MVSPPPNIAKNSKSENFPGENVLGKILMEMRDELILKKKNENKCIESVKVTRERCNSLPSLINNDTKKIQPELLRYIQRSKKRKLSSNTDANIVDNSVVDDVAVISRSDSETTIDVTESVCDVTPIK